MGASVRDREGYLCRPRYFIKQDARRNFNAARGKFPEKR
ncbi:hypothetical protein HMPREF1139_2142 [Campylobacter sp. FOBRC14]|nr:hypothetical protein HMPREF1139_2142 [Campylobacter sp. FOBRC14]